MLGGADWRPAPVAFSGVDAGTIARMIVSRAARSEAERAAEILRLPLSWPENFGADCRGLHRAAACAAELGAAAPFALAALRLGFSGGFDLSDTITLAEAAAAARLPVQRCQEAAEDPRYDQVLYVNSRELQAAGLSRRPAIRIGGHWCEGRNAVIEAAALRTASAEIDTRPAG
jgi:2-hydroxychromene-2-carboxylate isomerase